MKRKEVRFLLLLIDDLEKAQAEYVCSRSSKDPVDQLHLTVDQIIEDIRALLRGEAV